MSSLAENQNHLAELEELRARLAEAEDTLQAIRSGEVDALVVNGPQGEQIFTLVGADQPYRVLIEQMNDGAVTLTADGVILYCNRSFAALLGLSPDLVISEKLISFVAPSHHATLLELLKNGQSNRSEGEVSALTVNSTTIPLRLSFSRLPPDSAAEFCVVAVDLTEQRQREKELWQAQALLEARVRERTANLAEAIRDLKDSRAAALNMMADAVEARNVLEKKNAELEQTEAALAGEVTRFKTLLQTSHDGIHILNDKGDLLEANEAFLSTLGYTVADVGNLNVRDWEAQWTRAEMQERLRTVPDQNPLFETRHRRRDGSILDVEVSVNRIHLNGEALLVCISRDITERKRAAEQSELFLRLIDQSSDGIVLVNAVTGNMLHVNESACSQLGYTRDELKLMRILDISTELYSPELWEQHLRGLRTQGSLLAEYVAKRKDDSLFPIEISIRYVEINRQEYLLAVTRDISERKRAQAELARLAAAVEHAADSIVITDPHGNIEYVNPAFERVTGYAKEEAVGANPRMWKSGIVAPAVYRDLWSTISRGDVWEGQLVNRKKNGELFNESATISAVFESGKIAHFVAVKKDITHEQQLEEQLRQSQKMEAIGQLAGGVAHDFNNLLTAINGYSSLALQRVNDDPRLSGFLEEINKAGNRAANLTRQLLAFGRKQILLPIQINLNDVITDMNKMVRRLIGEDIILTTRLEPALGKIKADPGQIEQVLMNLIVNSRDAMPKGGQLTIETANVELDGTYSRQHPETVPGSYIMLAVTDSGFGIEQSTLNRIFEPFFTTKEKGKGTGLGLSTVYGIVKQSGGNIFAYSEVGLGTTFKVYLPCVNEVAEEIKLTKDKEVQSRGSETILLVEDEHIVRDLTSEILADSGYKVLNCPRPEEAVAVAQAHRARIDLLLSDVVMPKLSGPEVAERFCAEFPDTKVLFMSGYTDDAIVNHGVLKPGVEFIQKPFSPGSLTQKIRKILDN